MGNLKELFKKREPEYYSWSFMIEDNTKQFFFHENKNRCLKLCKLIQVKKYKIGKI